MRGTALAAARTGRTPTASKQKDDNRGNIVRCRWVVVEIGLCFTEDYLSVWRTFICRRQIFSSKETLHGSP